MDQSSRPNTNNKNAAIRTTTTAMVQRDVVKEFGPALRAFDRHIPESLDVRGRRALGVRVVVRRLVILNLPGRGLAAGDDAAVWALVGHAQG